MLNSNLSSYTDVDKNRALLVELYSKGEANSLNGCTGNKDNKAYDKW